MICQAIKTWYATLEDTTINNDDHRSYVPNIKDTAFISVKHKIKNDDHRSSIEH